MMNKELETKADELREEMSIAQHNLSVLQAPTNRLSTDPKQQKAQYKEMQDALLAYKTAKKTYDGFLDRVADMLAEENISDIFDDPIQE